MRRTTACRSWQSHQPDLRKRGSDKLAALRATISALHDHGYSS